TYGVQGVDGVAGLRADFIGQAQGTDDLTVCDHVQDDGAFVAPLVRHGQFIQVGLLQQVRTADLDLGAVDGSFDPNGRGGGEAGGPGNVQCARLRGAGGGRGQWVLAGG